MRIFSVGFGAPRTVETFGYEEGPLPEGHFDLDTLYSGVSAGTELTQYRGSNPYLHGRWDEDLKLFVPGVETGRQSYPIRFMGYMEVGRVIASRAAGVREGDVVAMAYGHKSGHRADAGRDHFVLLPADLDLLLGTYVAQMGPICANGILHADEDALGARVTRLAGAWDRRRLALETLAFLRDSGGAVREHLITHVVPFAQAQEIYDALDAGRPGVVQAVLCP